MGRLLENVKFLPNQRVLLKFSDKSEIRLNELDYFKFNLRIGDEFSVEAEAQLNAAKESTDCKKKAMDFLSRRPHGTRELRQKLQRGEKFSKENIEQTIHELINLKYLDDNEFCRLYIEDSLNLRSGDGSQKIRQKLLAKGLPRQLIDENLRLFSLNTEEELVVVKELAQRKWRSYPAQLEFLKKKARLYRFLASRGFSSAVVSRTVQEFRNNGGVK